MTFFLTFSHLRLEKLRTKLDREIALQKPKLEIVRNKKEELANRLADSVSKETELNNSCDTVLQTVSDEDVKQLVKNEMRMKQLEVTWISFSFQSRLNTFFVAGGQPGDEGSECLSGSVS